MNVLKDQFDNVVATDLVTDGNRSGIDARYKESINRLINNDPNMFDNSERSEMIYQSKFEQTGVMVFLIVLRMLLIHRIIIFV